MGSRFKTQDENTMKDILESSSMIFKIPVNQRQYSWEREQIEQYWEDILKIIEDSNCSHQNNTHYLGVISLIRTDKQLITEYEVIDGQQRLITTLLLISALRDVYIANDDINAAINIQKSYLMAVQPRESFNKLESCKIDSFTFKHIVNINEGKGRNITIEVDKNIKLTKNGYRKINKNEDEYINKNMLYAYQFFYKKIIEVYENLNNEEEKLNFLLDLEESLGKLELILVISYNEESLFLFFDSLNNRGLQLSKMDIIRNNYLKIISSKFSSNINEFSNLWDKLVVVLDDYDGVKFLKYYYMCTECKIFQSKQLPNKYEEYFKQISNMNDMKQELMKMIDYANIYTLLFEKGEETSNDPNYIRNVKRINTIGQQACHSFLMDYYYYVKDNARREKITSIIEKMMYRRVICKWSTKNLDGIFRDMIKTRKEQNGNIIYDDGQLINIVKENTPEDSEFERCFKNKNWDNDNVTSYTLRKYEMMLMPPSGAFVSTIKSRKEVHIEHIMPENFNEEWKRQLRVPKEDYEKHIYKIGNLILLENDINTSIKDKLYDFKKQPEQYGKSTLNQVKELINKYNKWDTKTINDRTKELTQTAKEIWKF